MKQISLNIIRNNLYFGSHWTTFNSAGVVLVSQSLLLLEESSCCPPFRRSEWGFPLNLTPPNLQSLLVKSGINTRFKDSVYIQVTFRPVNFKIVQIRHLILACVHILCTHTWEHFVSHFHSSSLVGGNATRARWLFQKSCLWDNNKLQAARGISLELIVISWTRSFTVRATECGAKSSGHSKPSANTEEILLLYCRLKVYEMRTELIFVVTCSNQWGFDSLMPQTALFGTGSVVADCEWWGSFSEKEMVFHFRRHD